MAEAAWDEVPFTRVPKASERRSQKVCVFWLKNQVEIPYILGLYIVCLSCLFDIAHALIMIDFFSCVGAHSSSEKGTGNRDFQEM